MERQKKGNRADRLLQLRKDFSTPKRFVFDIDGVITAPHTSTDYHLAVPNYPMIQVINQLYAKGHEIILFTARGYVTGIDWRSITEQQLAEWGVSYHELHFGKPNADYYVDDRMLDMELLLKLAEQDSASSRENTENKSI